MKITGLQDKAFIVFSPLIMEIAFSKGDSPENRAPCGNTAYFFFP